MTPTNRPSHREAMRDEAAEKAYPSAWDHDGSKRHSDYDRCLFKAGADWQYEQDKARIEKLEAALQVCKKQMEYWNYELKATIGEGMHSTLDHHIARLIDPGVRMIDETLIEAIK